MNDRYLYFPLLGAAALAGAGISFLYGECSGKRALPLCMLISLPLLLLPLATYQRTAVWANPVTLWNDTVAKIPDRSSAWEKLGEAYHAADPSMKAAAVRAYQVALNLAPSSEITLYNLGVLHTELGSYTEASAVLNRLLESNPDHVMAWAALGDLLQHQGRLAEADTALGRALELQPDAMQVVRMLADLSFKQKRYERADSYYLQLESKGWGDAVTAYNLACMAARQEQKTAALDWLAKALARGLDDHKMIAASQEFSGLLTDPAFQALLTRYPPRRGNGK